ncbi:hypothetical protein CD149_02185 [Staphylococcus condimenti]|uniref:Uncharacterized protein n=2 Tax=Staphylococcus condimenti TaxID=70255 RepID=A0AB37H3S6_9STAP|nr:MULTISPECIES: hypothetical protein [Staphylococcus]AMY06444.1 hypothetical protein A4G25_11085 [Staphylococcus condimenti]APR60326.1 hypothetical protein BTZ13_03500 [Staphylococcus condimenti]MDK8644212.1 hypothetical protein [Staphylococcus condimenti]OFP00288.1 hypothetical protein HMPREF3007_11930 [Staphylococcus sp. HMSC065E08]PNZ62712.1 hypothetical protein CD149_02185 [Staphylococcus condimenti]
MTTTSLIDIYKNLAFILSKSEAYNSALLRSKQKVAQSNISEINNFIQKELKQISTTSSTLTYFEKRYFDVLSTLSLYPLTTIDVGDFQYIIAQWQSPINQLIFEIINASNHSLPT